LKNPKFEFKKASINVEMLEEVKYCLENYGDVSTGVSVPYWTKNPPVEMYKAKLMKASYELFAAMQASE
jgi:hypothetical protein